MIVVRRSKSGRAPVGDPDSGVREPRSGPDGGAEPARRRPERRSAVTGAAVGRETALRFVIGPGDQVFVDFDHKLPGRGAWVEDERTLLEKAVAKNAFARAFRKPCKVSPTMPDEIVAAQRARCLSRLGLIRRAGGLSLGHDQVLITAGRRAPGALILASDGSPREKRKLRQNIVSLHGPLPVVESFDSRELAMALGRERVIHASVVIGRMAQSWLAEYLRLLRVSGAPLPDWREDDLAGPGHPDRDPDDDDEDEDEDNHSGDADFDGDE